MEARNLRKERTGVVLSNKMERPITVAAKFKEKHPIYGKFVSKRRNTMLMMKRMNAISVILYTSWKLVL